MSKKTTPYQIDNDVDIAELASSIQNFETSQVSDKSMELLAQMLSFLYEEDKKLAATKTRS